MKGMGSVVALVAGLVLACLFLLWKYTGWRRRMRAAATALVCVAVALAFVPLLTGGAKEPPSIVRVSELELAPVPVLASPEEALPQATPEPPAGEEQEPREPSDPVPEETQPEAEAPELPEPSEAPPSPPASPEPAAAEPPQSSQTQAGAPAYYILNKSTKKFHLPTCSDAARIKPENYATIATRQGAVDGGYVACKRCNP